MGNDLKSLQQAEYRMLKDTAQFCDDNDIKYFMVAGTLLGAIRHGGFIPWDDDIDIAMDLKNYKKFLRLSEHFPNEYFVQNYKSEKKYSYPWTKTRMNGTTSMDPRLINYDIHSGVCMDIFLFNGVSDSVIRRKIQSFSAQIQRILLRKYYYIEGDTNRKYNKTLYILLPEFVRRFSDRGIG